MALLKPPHLTPRSLVGRRFPPGTFNGVRIAIVGYCPPPRAIGRFGAAQVEDQHFIHVAPESVRILSHGGLRVLSLAHVYGGPVSASTVEELAYYGIDTILAYGLAGGLGTAGLAMGDVYLVESAYAADGTTRHYSPDPVLFPDPDLANHVRDAWHRAGHPPMTDVRAATGDAIYREDDSMLDGFRAAGCDIVNLDSSHLYAASLSNSEGRRLRTVQCGVISDVVLADPAGASESTLATMLSSSGHGGLNPLERVGDLVAFYMEDLAPRLLET